MDRKDFEFNIKLKVEKLNNHPLYSEIKDFKTLNMFMERHVYAVFDFMSLTKSIQKELAPTNSIWTPARNSNLARFINEIVLCEESDETPDGRVMSHFEMYCHAMAEVKASCDMAMSFVRNVSESGLDESIEKFDEIPKSAKSFMNYTFNLIKEGRIHKIAAAFCYGREKVIPLMFKGLLKDMNISKDEAPMFHFYLNRHIEVDGDSHGPIALQMLEVLCDGDEKLWIETQEAALNSLEARIKFWDDVLEEMTFSSNVLPYRRQEFEQQQLDG